MACLLEFLPPSILPEDIRAPPYVIFAINGNSVKDILPPRIPQKMVLHFAPKLAQFVLPVPDNLPPAVAQGVLRTPYVGIDIRLDIGPASLQRIVFKMMQTAGFAVPNNVFLHKPSLITSISIRRTWQMLELHPAGLDGLFIHMQTSLMMGPPVTFTEIRELWAHFPADHIILRLAAKDFVQAHTEWVYSRDEFNAIRKWYSSSEESYKVFKAAEDQCPDFGKIWDNFPSRERINSSVAERARKAKEHEQMVAEQEAIAKRMEALEIQKRNAVKGPRAMSMDDMEKDKENTTVRKSMRVSRSLPDLTDKREEVGMGQMGRMTAMLDDALRKVQAQRDAEDKADDDTDEQVATSKDGGTKAGDFTDTKDGDEMKEMLQPTVYDPSKAAKCANDDGA